MLTSGRASLRAAPDVTVTRVALGLTAYLDDTLLWARGGAARALEAFIRWLPIDRPYWFLTSVADAWERTDAAHLPELVAALSDERLRAPRHLFRFTLADDRGAASAGFTYREFDPGERPRQGYLQCVLPLETDPAALFQLALEIASIAGVFSALGGHLAVWNERYPTPAFDEIYRLARRYAGLDISDPEGACWLAPSSLPSVSWVTLLGAPLLATAPDAAAALRRRAWANEVLVVDAPRGALLVRAGSTPDLGDLNTLRFPHALAEVACALDPWVTAPPKFWGTFREDDAARRWQKRFTEPEGWLR
jgi:hypothetical protein